MGKRKPPKRARKPRRPPGPVDITALTIPQLGELLGVPARTLRIHVKAGAPCTAGRPRRVSLIEYAAWLNREVQRRGQATG